MQHNIPLALDYAPCLKDFEAAIYACESTLQDHKKCLKIYDYDKLKQANQNMQEAFLNVNNSFDKLSAMKPRLDLKSQDHIHTLLGRFKNMVRENADIVMWAQTLQERKIKLFDRVVDKYQTKPYNKYSQKESLQYQPTIKEVI